MSKSQVLPGPDEGVASRYMRCPVENCKWEINLAETRTHVSHMMAWLTEHMETVHPEWRGVPKVNEKSLTLRIGRGLHARAVQRAIDQNVSLNNLIGEAIERYLSREGHRFPPSELGGRATYQAMIEWAMPSFGETEEVIERMLAKICELIEEYDAVGPISAHANKIIPMTLKKLERFPVNG